MRLIIKGKVLDEQGLPLLQVAEVKEIPIPGNTGTADVLTDENDGTYTYLAMWDTSVIEVSSYGYSTQRFPATAVPAVIKLVTDPAFAINAANPPKKAADNTWMYWAGGVALLIAAAKVFGGNSAKPAPQQKQGLTRPAIKAKKVTVY